VPQSVVHVSAAGRDRQLSKRSASDEYEMTGWVVEVVEDDDGEWWCRVALLGTMEGIEDGPYPSYGHALDVGNKIAYDHWVSVREPSE
jgi:hypothetical protein